VLLNEHSLKVAGGLKIKRIADVRKNKLVSPMLFDGRMERGGASICRHVLLEPAI
jgi:hypothetical protein